jgi:AraC-like DNA-binding protein
MDGFPKGVLNPATGQRTFSLTRYMPADDMAMLVQHYWLVKWDLRGQSTYVQKVLAHPNVNLVFERGMTRIYGVARSASEHRLEDYGWVAGVKFNPGGFYPFWKAPVSQLTGRSVSLEKVFGTDTETIEQAEQAVFANPDEQQAAECMELFLRERLPATDPYVKQNVKQVTDIVFQIRDDRSIVKVEDVVQKIGINKRTLQRLFDRYVGVSPKGVIQRYRLHEAAESISRGEASDWSALSLELGYYDQSHFIRDFKAIVGASPGTYASLNKKV